MAALATACCLLLLPFSIQANGASVIDGGDLFTPDEERKLEQKAEEIARKYNTNVVILTADYSNQLEGEIPPDKYPSSFSDNEARDLIETYGTLNYPQGYIGYAIDMNDRSYWADAYGPREREVFTQSVMDKLADGSLEALKDGDYYAAANEFLNGVNIQWDIRTSPLGILKKPLIYKGWTLVFLGGSGALAALLAAGWTGLKMARHRDKKEAHNAALYQQQLKLAQKQDRFKRVYQTRRPVPKSTSSGGGGSHGGGASAGHTGSGGHF